MKLVAVLACRNQSTRLYAKPLQNLDVEKGVSILDYMIAQIRHNKTISQTVLVISEQQENLIYQEIAKFHEIQFVIGSDRDVLDRLIKGGELAGADHILRVTTESPYTCYDDLPMVFDYHCKKKCDYSVVSGLPDGAYYEIIRLDALKKSWQFGGEKHRSELCTLYIFEHQDQFKIIKHPCKKEFQRQDIRLTVDWPEDLIVMREIYRGSKLSPSEVLNFGSVIDFLDNHPKINTINNWIDSGVGRIWY